MSYEERDSSIVRAVQDLKDKPAWAVSSDDKSRWVLYMTDARVAFANTPDGLRLLLDEPDPSRISNHRDSSVEAIPLEAAHWMEGEYAYRVTREEVDALHMALLLMPDGNAWFQSPVRTPLELGFNLAGRPRIF